MWCPRLDKASIEKMIAIRTMQSSPSDCSILTDQAESGSSAPLLQGPCPPTIAGHAVNPSMEALARHPCRSRSRDGERARTSGVGRYATFSTSTR
ncbi:hypothetical protein FHR55_002192 [Xanthomonas arboricola]